MHPPNSKKFKTDIEIIMGLLVTIIICTGLFVASAVQSDVSKWQYLYFIYHIGFMISLLSLAIAIFVQYAPLPPA